MIRSILLSFALILNCLIDLKADIIGGSPGAQLPDFIAAELDPQLIPKLGPCIDAFRLGEFTRFRTLFNKLASENDSLPPADLFWCKLLINNNRFGDATRLVEQFLVNNPQDPEAYLVLSTMAVRSGRLTDAWLNLVYAQRLMASGKLKAARLKLLDPLVVDMRAGVAEGRKQWSEADELYRQLQKFKPDDMAVKFRAGRCKALSGDLKAGSELMQTAYKNANKLPKPSLTIAQMLADNSPWSQNPEQAVQVRHWFEKAVGEYSTDGSVWAAYFKWLLLANLPDEVIATHERLPASTKESRDVRLMRGLAARYVGDLKTAEDILSALHRDNIDDVEASDQLALVLVESENEFKRGRALQLAERNLRQLPEVEAIVATAAWVQLKHGSRDVADQLLTQLATRGPLSPQSAYYVSELYQSVGQKEEAMKVLGNAVSTIGLFPQRAHAKRMLEQK
jgi:tetratricopeptide (TPR) repeat protein